ncbi:MAG TPA: HIT family protein [Luteibaculaceae bacterium]|nr:HIT family protein [Luteibaculaceae bacterium]
MASIFSRIVSGEIPCHKIDEDDEFLAFLDVMPLVQGHVLVIPKVEIDYIFDIDDHKLGRMMAFAKKIAAAQRKSIPCKRIGVSVIGLEVPHAHIHLVPMNDANDVNFTRAKLQVDADRLREMAALIRENL